MKHVFILAIIFMLFSAQGNAQTVITKLGTAPLIGPITSRDQLVGMIAPYSSYNLGQRWADAESALGLTESQAADLNLGLFGAPYGVLPTHLDAMAYYSGGVMVLHNVTIPAGTKGWQLVIAGATIYIPQACGNLSVVYHKKVVIQPQKRAAPIVLSAPVTATVEPPQTAPPIPTTQEQMPATPTPAPATRHCRVCFGLFLIPLFFFVHGSDHSDTLVPLPRPTTTLPARPPYPSPQPSFTMIPRPSPSFRPLPSPTPTPCPTRTP